MDVRMRNLSTRYLQVDEIWTYVGKKRRNVRSGDSPELGDQWVYVAIDAETKLVPSFRIGKRVRPDTWRFSVGLTPTHCEPRATHHGWVEPLYG
jgi:hypothetical protein